MYWPHRMYLDVNIILALATWKMRNRKLDREPHLDTNHMQDSKGGAQPVPVPKARQSSRLRWLLGSIVAGFIFSRVWLQIQTRDDYTLCSRTTSIYTVDETQPRVQCISVRDGRISAVGDEGWGSLPSIQRV
jgi:hypothetical protein